jgi:hypothetical protein
MSGYHTTGCRSFCPEHRSWFCPCVFPFLYKHRLGAWERRWSADDDASKEWDGLALEAELDSGYDEQGALW